MTAQEIIIWDSMQQVPKDRWAAMWCTLNRWEFPEQLLHVKPVDWDTQKGKRDIHQQSRYVVGRFIMNAIVNEIGMKACNREWNKDRMTDEEHEAFWKSGQHF